MLAVALPGWRMLLARHQAQAALERLVAFLQEAQARAIVLQRPVVVCPSWQGRYCDAQTWQAPLAMFAEVTDGDSTLALLTRITLLGEQSHASLSYHGFGSSRYLRFLSDGFLYTSNGRFRYKVVADGTPVIRELTINHHGRMAIQPAA